MTTLDVDAAAPFATPLHSGFYTDGDENIRLTLFNSLVGVSVRLAGRFQHLDGRIEPFEHRMTPASDRTASVLTQRLARGWLLNLHVYVNAAAPITGQTFAIVSLVRGQGGGVTELATLAAGYVTANQRIAWPGSIVGNSLDGGGAIRTILGSGPAAGFEVAETVPTGARWELLGFRVMFNTSAAVANRSPQLRLTTSGNNFYELGPAAAQAASLAKFYGWFAGGPSPVVDSLLNAAIPLPIGIRLASGASIGTFTTNLQALDQFTLPTMLVREWIEGF